MGQRSQQCIVEHVRRGTQETLDMSCPNARRRSSGGHSLTEYSIGLCLVVIGLVLVLGTLEQALEGYHDRHASWLSMPFP